ncbi:MAG: EAL domain-containing protein [Desulfobacteraceae bacterium]|nr:EAL domain-containing protein [Desulfobacteraceae bacterium]
MDIYVGRQPILDMKRNTIAYEILYRSGDENAFPGIDGTAATSIVINNVFCSMGLNEVGGGRRIFINFTRQLLLSGIPPLDPDSVIIEILEDVKVDEPLIEACRDLVDKGFKLALDDFILNEESALLAPLASIIKVDWQNTTAKEMADILKLTKTHGPELLAEKVETYNEFTQALSLGFTYFQGYFFARPAILKGKDIAPSVWSILKLVTAIQQAHLDINEVAGIITKDPALCYKLLRVINAAAIGLRQPISSIKQAILLLGEIELRRWLSILLVVNIAGDKPLELINTACIRASFMEKAAVASGHLNYASSAFFMGICSLLDAMLEKPLEEILRPLDVAPEIINAIVYKKGPLLPYMALMLSYEQGHVEEVAKWAGSLGISDAEIVRCYLEAVNWASGCAATTAIES